MKKLLKILALVVALGLVVLVLRVSLVGVRPPELVPGPEVGYQAPDFTLSTLGGGEVTLSNLQSQPVFINFWSYT